ncbi:ABC transporter substrate-binding protein [bacterium]|nr:ABC transporter substrate-binding protein [bacterium]
MSSNTLAWWLLFIALLLRPTVAFALPAGKVGYGSATTVISAAYGENVFIGFELGFEKVLGRARAKDLLIVKQGTDKSLRGAVTVAEDLVKEGAVFLVGFPVSHDALLVGDYAVKNHIQSLFGGAAHSDLAKKGPEVLSSGSSMEHLVSQLEVFLKKQFAGKRGLAISNPYAVFSANQARILKERVQNGEIAFETREVNEALVLPPSALAEIKAGKFDYIYLTLYPEDLVALLNQLTTAGVDLPMITWGGPDTDVLKRFISEMKSPYYIGSPWMPSRDKTRDLDRAMQAKFGRKSNSEIVIGYNLGLVAGQMVARVKGPLTRESVRAAFTQDPCFEGLGKVPVCFPRTGGHASLTVEFQRYNPATAGKKP